MNEIPQNPIGGKPDELPLSDNIGRANEIFADGCQRMRARLAEPDTSPDQINKLIENARIQYNVGLPHCESPIECMTLAALVTSDWRSDWHPDWRSQEEIFVDVVPSDGAPELDSVLIIYPQFKLRHVRLDFAISVRPHAYILQDRSRMWAVECDGKEFHQDGYKWRDRDAFINSCGIDVLHISGSEIHKNVNLALMPLVNVVNYWKML